MWQLDGSIAKLESAQLQCKLHLAEPSRGLTNIQIRMGADDAFCDFDASLFQITLPGSTSKLEDAYVRGDDLVATYAESRDYPCRMQIYWRLHSDVNCVGIQLIVSVQTSRLDSTPAMAVANCLPDAAEVNSERIACVRPAKSDLCYAEFADDSNVDRSVVSGKHITTHLFPGLLEKGVICRARIVGYFLAASTAEQLLPSLYDQFIESTPPLTT